MDIVGGLVFLGPRSQEHSRSWNPYCGLVQQTLRAPEGIYPLPDSTWGRERGFFLPPALQSSNRASHWPKPAGNHLTRVWETSLPARNAEQSRSEEQQTSPQLANYGDTEGLCSPPNQSHQSYWAVRLKDRSLGTVLGLMNLNITDKLRVPGICVLTSSQGDSYT